MNSSVYPSNLGSEIEYCLERIRAAEEEEALLDE